MNIEQARFNMIEQQVRPWKVFDEKLLGAMSAVPRELFVAKEQRGLAFADTHLPLGHQQSMLAPREIARLIQALELKTEDKVLEIGTGSGYSAALLAKLAKQVFSVEIIAEFVKSSQQIHRKLAIENVIVEEGDACDGWAAHGPYDAVLITAALPELADSMKRNLAKNGRVVSILEHTGLECTGLEHTGLEYSGGQMATLSQLDENNEWQHEYLFPVSIARMINAETINQFVF